MPRINEIALVAASGAPKVAPVMSRAFSPAKLSRNPRIFASGASIAKSAPRERPRLSEASTMKASINICLVLTSNSEIIRWMKLRSDSVAFTIK